MAVAAAYAEPVVLDPVSGADALARLIGMARMPHESEYQPQLFLAAVDGSLRDDLTSSLLRGGSDGVVWDSTAAVPGNLTVTLDASRALVWGGDVVAAYQLVRNHEYNLANGLDPATWWRFPIGHYVATSPGFTDLDASDQREVTGFDKNYLLQNQLSDTMSWDAGTQYVILVRNAFQAAGLVTSYLSEVCDYPAGADWATKTLPAPVSYGMDGQTTYLDIVNEQLKASGARPIYTQPTGRWQVALTPTAATQALRWRWAASPGTTVTDLDLDTKVVIGHTSQYQGDVWNVPNQWVFIQDGLTFDPVEGSGQYTVNNTTLPPSDQTTVGRVVRATYLLQASTQADLVTQGDEIVATQISQAERINFQTAPWPIAGHFDVFAYTHATMPFGETRRVQAQQWDLPLWGDPMRWTTHAVAVL